MSLFRVSDYIEKMNGFLKGIVLHSGVSLNLVTCLFLLLPWDNTED